MKSDPLNGCPRPCHAVQDIHFILDGGLGEIIVGMAKSIGLSRSIFA
jgi:hypothetical protein